MASITKLLLLLFVLSLLLLNVCSSESAAKKKKRRKKRRTRIPEGSSVSSSGSAAQEALSLFNQAQESAEIQKGIQFYKEALRLHPVFPMATWNLGLLYQQSQQFSELEALYSKALSVVHKTSEQEDLSGGSMARQLSAEPTVTTAHQLSSGTVSVVQVPYRAGVLFYLANLRGSFLRQQQQAASDDDTQRIVKVCNHFQATRGFAKPRLFVNDRHCCAMCVLLNLFKDLSTLYNEALVRFVALAVCALSFLTRHFKTYFCRVRSESTPRLCRRQF